MTETGRTQSEKKAAAAVGAHGELAGDAHNRQPTDRNGRPVPKNESDLAELSAHLKEIEGVDSDIADLLANNWQRFVGAVVLAIIAVWLFGSYKSTKEQRLALTSDRFQEIQNEFRKLSSDTAVDEKDDKKDNTGSSKSFTDQADLLVKAEKDTSYGKLAQLYQAAHAIKTNAPAEALKILESVKVKPLQGMPVSNKKVELDSELFISELAVLLKARALLADNVQANLTQVRELLVSAVEKGKFINSEAALILARISDSEESSKQSIQVANTLAEKRPDLRDALIREFGVLGISLK